MKFSVYALGELVKVFVFLGALILFSTTPLKAQPSRVEKLKAALLSHPQQDTARVNRLNALAFAIRNSDPPTALKYDNEAIELSKKLGYLKGQGVGELSLAFYYRVDAGSYQLSINYSKLALGHFKTIKDTLNQIACDYNLSSIYTDLGKADEGIIYDFEGLKLAEKKNSEKWLVLINYHLADRYATMGETIIAKRYITIAYNLAKKSNDNDGMAHCLTGLGLVSEQEGQWAEAQRYYRESVQLAVKMKETRQFYMSLLSITDMDERLSNYQNVIAYVDTCLAKFRSMQYPGSIPYAYSVKSRAYLHTGRPDSAVKYGLLSFRATQQSGVKYNTRNMSEILAMAYARLNNYREAYRYQVLFTNYKDSINNVAAIQKVAIAQYANDMEKKQSEIKLLTKNAGLEKLQNRQQKIILLFVIAGFIAAGVFSFVQLMSNRQKQQTNKLLIKQQDELKAAQQQLIQSEKLASLGELTAGIAHEIQNPLNFVKNFSEVSIELLTEMQGELDKGDTGEATAIAGDIKQNLEKISHHGKRADAIVKGMLEHSKTSSGTMEPTDVNDLADQYLKLAYHGFRANNKTFNDVALAIGMVTNFGPDLPAINLVPQDIGRVLLNLLNNAFYAVCEKQKTARPDYKPAVELSTRVFAAPNGTGRLIEIVIKDNGSGIPDAIKDKIMQPFFTTKPTGEGTGLGLSLSYDTVVKGHGGSISVDTKEGEFTAFTIKLPV